MASHTSRARARTAQTSIIAIDCIGLTGVRDGLCPFCRWQRVISECGIAFAIAENAEAIRHCTPDIVMGWCEGGCGAISQRRDDRANPRAEAEKPGDQSPISRDPIRAIQSMSFQGLVA